MIKLVFLFGMACPWLPVVQSENSNQQEASDEIPCFAPSLSIPSTVTSRSSKFVIAHRGASAHLPEHSLPAYRLALELGADFIQPDLVATKDGKLIALHSMDLNVTTNVADVYPDRQTFSNYWNRSGYWSYDFEWKELKTLKVKQRLPAARSTAFDNLFPIPTLKDILQLLLKWDTQVDKALNNVTTDDDHDRPRRGIFAEFKDYAWLQEDTGIDLLDLFFQDIQDNSDLWQSDILDRSCYRHEQKIHQYRIPPLIIQSFEGDVLQSFAKRWKDTFTDIAPPPTGSTSTITTSTTNNQSTASKMTIPVPPMVLLVDREKCLEESFWFQVGDTWREYISAIAPEKTCLFHEWREFMGEALRYNLLVHPWTERPELEYVGDEQMQFPTALEEIMYFFCTVQVHGVFSESVQIAVEAAHLTCPDTESNNDDNNNDSKNDKHATNRHDGKNSGDSSSLCYNSNQEASFYVGLASFVMGAFIATIFSLWKGRSFRQRGRRQQQVPTAEVPDDLEMT